MVRMAGGAVVIALAACAGKLLAIVDYRVIFPMAGVRGVICPLAAAAMIAGFGVRPVYPRRRPLP